MAFFKEANRGKEQTGGDENGVPDGDDAARFNRNNHRPGDDDAEIGKCSIFVHICIDTALFERYNIPNKIIKYVFVLCM